MTRGPWCVLPIATALLACRAPEGGEQGAAPRLHVARPRHDLGRIVQGEPARHAFVLANRGDALLSLDGVDPGRDCSANLPRTSVAPGETARVEVSCRPLLYGPLRESLTVRSNDPVSSRTVLELAAEVEPQLAFEREQVDFDVVFGDSERAVVRLTGTRAPSARLRVLDAGCPGLSARVLPPERDRPAGLELVFAPEQAGTRYGQLVVETGLDRPSQLELRCTCKARGTLEVSPTNPYFDLSIPGGRVRWIEVRSTAPGFRVHAVSVTSGPFRAALEPARPGAPATRVEVTVLEDRLEPGTRGVTGKLLIRSNDPSESLKEIPLFGMGDPAPSGAR